VSALAENAASDGPRSSLAKALDLMVVIAERGRNGITLSSAAKRAGVHVATAHRILAALVDQDFLSLDPYTKLYRLGIMPYEIVARAGSDLEFLTLRRRLRPVLEQVQAEVGGIATLSVVSRGEALCVDVVEGRSDISLNTLKVGSRRPLGAGAASLALLATLDPQEREAVIRRESERYRKYGTLTAAFVREACAAWQRDGYTFNARIIPGIGAVGIALFTAPDTLAGAVSVTDTVARLDPERRRDIALVLVQAVRSAGFKAMDIAA